MGFIPSSAVPGCCGKTVHLLSAVSRDLLEISVSMIQLSLSCLCQRHRFVCWKSVCLVSLSAISDCFVELIASM